MASTGYRHRSSRLPDPKAPIDVRSSDPNAPLVGPSKSSNAHRGSKKQKPAPFDPDDLCRRLQIVLAEEKAYTERKRRSRANIDRVTIRPQDGEGVRKGREVPLEILANQATATKSVEATAARRSILSASTAKRRSGNPIAESALAPQPPEKDVDASYQHVPRVAATQFSRTTTHEPTKGTALVHKLSRRAMKFHMEGPNAQADIKDEHPPDEQAKTFHRVREQREKTYGRNQFQHPAAISEVSTEFDDRQNRDGAYRHTFDTHFRTKHVETDEGDEIPNPRLSTSSARAHERGAAGGPMDFPIGAYPVLTHDSAEYRDMPVRAEEHRVDWTQSDERTPVPLSPTLRKAESRWKLRDRLSFHRTGKSEKDMLASEADSASPALRSQRSSFFARFKR